MHVYRALSFVAVVLTSILCEMSGFNKSKRDLRLRPISNWAGDTPVVL